LIGLLGQFHYALGPVDGHLTVEVSKGSNGVATYRLTEEKHTPQIVSAISRSELEGAEVIRVRELSSSDHKNGIYLVTLRTPTGTVTDVAFKPESGERYDFKNELSLLFDLKAALGAKPWVNEITTSKAAEALGIGDLVPTTGKLEALGAGSSQQFVSGKTVSEWLKENPSILEKVPPDQVQKLFALDFILGNIDRHVGNIMISQDGSLHAIDNGLVLFPDTQISFRFPRELLRSELTPEARAFIDQADPKALAEALAGCDVPEQATKAAVERLLYLKSNPELADGTAFRLASQRERSEVAYVRKDAYRVDQWSEQEQKFYRGLYETTDQLTPIQKEQVSATVRGAYGS
jgi:hypothetical protein